MNKERALWEFGQTVIPDYVKYIKNDNSLEEDTKRIREQTANEFMELINIILTGDDK